MAEGEGLRSTANDRVLAGANATGRPPPDGFGPHLRNSAVTDAWAPLFSRITPDCVQVGTWLRPVHCNARGFAHGGVLAALADIAMGLSLVYPGGVRVSDRSAVTVSLAIDYLGAGQLDQWLEVVPRILRSGRSLAFADALITADGRLVARANASFKVG